MIKPWKIVNSRVDRDYRVFRIRADTAISPRTNHEQEYYTVETRHWVNVMPLTSDGQVIMIHQYRHGARDVSLEIPGGLVDENDPREAAIRELMEETGYKGDRVTLLGSTNPNPAIFNNLCYTYLVEDARKAGEPCLEVDEDIAVEKIPLVRIPSLIADGTINHALVIVAFHFYWQKYGFPEKHDIP